ncbi:MAG TPA: DUF58 domain-containing protein [Acidimicrobiales bacterium]|nr:DUF58 domain-containing protein [Acidimicrobiales bacterium]
MLTRRGWLLLLGAAVLAMVGRLLGLVELFMLAASAVAMVAGAALYVRVRSFSVEATRELRPPRVPAGTDSRVELRVRNRGRRRSPVLAAGDPFDGGRRLAHFLLAPLDPGEAAKAAYRLPTGKRGIYDLGPLTLELSDPFGLARRCVVAAPVTSLTVFPRVDPIDAPAPTRGHDVFASANHPTALASSGEDFYALREYEVGDDLRRVHWKSSAKLDQLMIRQDEVPWQGRATVVLDLNPLAHTPDSLEVAVSAAASIVTACWRRRSVVRLVSTDGVDSGPGSAPSHLEAMLEHLAGAGLDGGAAGTGPAHLPRSLGAVLASLRREGDGAAVAVVTTSQAPDSGIDTVRRIRSRFGSVTLVVIETGAGQTGRPVAGLSSVVRVTPTVPFAAAWAESPAGRGGRRRTAATRRRPAPPTIAKGAP